MKLGIRFLFLVAFGPVCMMWAFCCFDLQESRRKQGFVSLYLFFLGILREKQSRIYISNACERHETAHRLASTLVSPISPWQTSGHGPRSRTVPLMCPHWNATPTDVPPPDMPQPLHPAAAAQAANDLLLVAEHLVVFIVAVIVVGGTERPPQPRKEKRQHSTT